MKRDEIMSLTGKWVELEITVLREISQAGKANITHFRSYVEPIILIITIIIIAINLTRFLEGDCLEVEVGGEGEGDRVNLFEA
jgi:hypothetical protein